MDDREKLMSEATKWLLEMEHVNNPQIKNSIVLNICNVSPSIKDVDLLIDTNSKSLLIWVKLSWFGLKFRKDVICKTVLEIISQALPSFRIRVVTEREIFDKALLLVKKIADQPKIYYE